MHDENDLTYFVYRKRTCAPADGMDLDQEGAGAEVTPSKEGSHSSETENIDIPVSRNPVNHIATAAT